MNIKELKEIIKDLPDDMPVCSCCDCGGDDGTGFEIREQWEEPPEECFEYLWCGGK